MSRMGPRQERKKSNFSVGKALNVYKVTVGIIYSTELQNRRTENVYANQIQIN